MSVENSLGVIDQTKTKDRIDYLFRISLKCLVRNENGEVLVVKEAGRDSWDLPGGGMNHGEDLKAAIAREMKEEVNMEDSFSYKVISVDDPAYLPSHGFWQVRIIFELKPVSMKFIPGEDADDITFVDPGTLKHSESEAERLIYLYANIGS